MGKWIRRSAEQEIVEGNAVTSKREAATDWRLTAAIVAVSVEHKPTTVESTWWCHPTDGVYCAPSTRSDQYHLRQLDWQGCRHLQSMRLMRNNKNTCMNSSKQKHRGYQSASLL
ncbi:unnamed protein product [Albugo candida]|uniref:Uncharacterized protein n=1 Tax=Albugo candida TaxID=65357 RepID=A0A024FY29_9STRA|nr:unnamed protein product [Albugo candida]|eukprot:CCI11559.1 unnamed protein product [Albugo candida]